MVEAAQFLQPRSKLNPQNLKGILNHIEYGIACMRAHAHQVMEAAESEESNLERKRRAPETGPYVLRSLLEDLPLSADGDRDDIEINCVEFLGTDNVRAVTIPGACP